MNPGSLKWYCSICQGFGSSISNQWVTGILLKEAPARKFTKHWKSLTHRNSEGLRNAFNLKGAKKKSYFRYVCSKSEC